MDITSICTNYLIVLDEAKNREVFDSEVKTLIVAIAILCLWFRLFYWMRIFEKPAYFILMISKTLSHIVSFLILLAIILLLFANMLYVINCSKDPNNPSETKTLFSEESEYNFYNALIHTYLIGLGDFSTDDYEARGSMQKQFVWIIFLAATFLIQLTFMNMLIAIMGDVYGQVTAKEK